MNPTSFPIETDKPKLDVKLPVGRHGLRLYVKDNTGLISGPDSVVVTVQKVGAPHILYINPEEGLTGDVLDGVIIGINLHEVRTIKVFQNSHEDARIKLTLQPGGSAEKLPVTIQILDHAEIGSRTIEVTTTHGIATIEFRVIAGSAIESITPTWDVVGRTSPTKIQIDGKNLERVTGVSFLRGGKKDPHLAAVVREMDETHVLADLTISVNAEFGERTFIVTTPSTETASPAGVTFTVMPSIIQSGIMLLTLATAIIHLTLAFPNVIFILNGLGYLALLAALYAPTRWLFSGLRPTVRWVLIAYTLVTIIAWIIIGERSTLAYVTKAIEVLLIGLLFVESRQP